MNKAKNFEEFESALKLLGIPRFNIVYGDRYDNIFYMSNARLSVRDPNINWKELVIGDKSSLILNEYHPYEDLPKILNPSSGYLFNTNNSPFNSTRSDLNLLEKDFNTTFNFKEKENNRSQRFMDLISEFDKIDYSDFKKIKYDQKYPDSIHFIGNISNIFSFKKNKFSGLEDILTLIQNWNREGDYDNLGAAQWSMYYSFIGDLLEENNIEVEDEISDNLHELALRKAKKYLIKHFGKVDILLGQLQRHVRGDKDLPISGMIDMIAPSYVVNYEDGKYRAVSGESYIMLVKYDKDNVEIETILPYGNSNDNQSVHYTDQMEMYINKELKRMTLDKKKIFEEAVKIYNPN